MLWSHQEAVPCLVRPEAVTDPALTAGCACKPRVEAAHLARRDVGGEHTTVVWLRLRELAGPHRGQRAVRAVLARDTGRTRAVVQAMAPTAVTRTLALPALAAPILTGHEIGTAGPAGTTVLASRSTSMQSSPQLLGSARTSSQKPLQHRAPSPHERPWLPSRHCRRRQRALWQRGPGRHRGRFTSPAACTSGSRSDRPSVPYLPRPQERGDEGAHQGAPRRGESGGPRACAAPRHCGTSPWHRLLTALTRQGIRPEHDPIGRALASPAAWRPVTSNNEHSRAASPPPIVVARLAIPGSPTRLRALMLSGRSPAVLLHLDALWG